MPVYLSHKLQPFDIECFGPLKWAYNKEIKGFIWVYIIYISKEDFLLTFYKVYNVIIT